MMIDDKLNVWLLEVNFSPSLACETRLDAAVKGALVSDLLNLTGIVSYENQKSNIQADLRKLNPKESNSANLNSSYQFGTYETNFAAKLNKPPKGRPNK